MRETIKAQDKRIAELEAENKRLLEDRRRLEWVMHEWEHDFGENWREAIDAETHK